MTNVITEVKVDPLVQSSYDQFMKLFHEDVYKIIKDQFQVQLTIQIAVEEKNIHKAAEAQRVVKKMMNSSPSTYNNPKIIELK